MKKMIFLLLVVFMFTVSCAVFVINTGSGRMMEIKKITQITDEIE